jgi:hypothetical protein
MIAWRERKMALLRESLTSWDLRLLDSWRVEVQALRHLLDLMAAGVDPPRSILPQGLWSDHHAAMHSDCDWDWAGAIEAEAARDTAYSDEAQQQAPAVIDRPLDAPPSRRRAPSQASDDAP